MDDDFGTLKIITTETYCYEQQACENQDNKRIVIQNELKSQIYHNLSITTSSLHNNINIKQSLTKKDIEIIQRGLPIPQTNYQYSFFLPQSLENQFITRFTNNQFSYVFDHSLRNLSVLQMLNKEIVKTSDLNTESFQDRYMDSVRIVTNFTLENLIPNQKVVLLLLDFHQHPLTVAHFIQFLTRLNYKVVCPYLPDVYIKSEMINPELSYQYIINLISETKTLLIPQPFQIIAHGTSAPIGLRIHQQYGMECQKVILCNPLLNFQNESLEIETQQDAEEVDATPYESSRTVEFSLEPINKNLPTLTRQPSEPSIIEQVDIPQQRLQQKAQRSKLQQQVNVSKEPKNRTYSLIEQLIQSDVIDLEQTMLDDLVQLINSQVEIIYKDVSLLSGLMKAHDVNRLSELELVTNISKFWKINSLITPVSFMFRAFIRLLYSVFVFSPLEQIEQYHIYKSVFDRHFFESFAEMKIMLETNKTQWTDDMNLYNLISSHDCLISEDFLQEMRDSKANFKKMHCRTIVGAGHDMFSVAGTVIEKLLR
ncbi:Alpha/Beta_hydrolase fold [Hexamita inflata]|uniref:Alpha/Beta hydrolase fold n=1 Tax=Hexamita inflata TaxID=28002 RepID=A0AA86RB83_9EUKA|nr:Alpha/Beta hydrolase fold [Hexamita inflata]